MHKIIQIGKLPNLEKYIDYLENIVDLEVVEHRYGEKMNVPYYPCWMRYQLINEGSGSISFTRNTWKHPYLINMTHDIIDYFNSIFVGMNFDYKRVHFIRTLGFIPPHVDESGRISCINIGIKNSTEATVLMSNDGILNNFKTNNTTYTIENGGVYLVNTSNIHSVESTFPSYRYMITYGFGIPIEVLLNTLRK